MKIPVESEATLEVRARLYFTKKALLFHDVDNRLKDIMAAMHGRMGGAKKFRKHAPIIPNDWQIFRAEIQKGLAPRQSKGRSHLEIRRLR